VEAEKAFFSKITKLDRSSLSIVNGLASGAFVILPFAFAPLIGFVSAAFAAFGGMWLTNTAAPKSRSPIFVLFVASLTESISVGLGTLAGTAGVVTPALVGVGVFIPMLVHGNPKWSRVGTYTAITFAVGAGIPGDFVASLHRMYFSVLGALLALLGIWVRRYLSTKKLRGKSDDKNAEQRTIYDRKLHEDAFRNAIMIGLLSAFGLWIGMMLGLPRDFWVVITIILTVQPSFNATLTFTSRMVFGTVIGAAIGAIVLFSTNNIYIHLVFLLIFAILMFAVSGVNTALVQIFLAPFIIIILNIIYSGEANFAEARIFDVALGGAISLATVYILGLKSIRKYWKELRNL
jgi:MFS family permease